MGDLADGSLNKGLVTYIAAVSACEKDDGSLVWDTIKYSTADSASLVCLMRDTIKYPAMVHACAKAGLLGTPCRKQGNGPAPCSGWRRYRIVVAIGTPSRAGRRLFTEIPHGNADRNTIKYSAGTFAHNAEVSACEKASLYIAVVGAWEKGGCKPWALQPTADMPHGRGKCCITYHAAYTAWLQGGVRSLCGQWLRAVAVRSRGLPGATQRHGVSWCRGSWAAWRVGSGGGHGRVQRCSSVSGALGAVAVLAAAALGAVAVAGAPAAVAVVACAALGAAAVVCMAVVMQWTSPRPGLTLRTPLACDRACAVAAGGCTAVQRARGERWLALVCAATVLAAPPGSARNLVEGARPCSL